jgi:hypothetical protein
LAPGGGELMDLSHANVDLARGAIARHRDVVVGVKARLSAKVAGTNDLEALRGRPGGGGAVDGLYTAGPGAKPLRRPSVTQKSTVLSAATLAAAIYFTAGMGQP